MKKLLASILFAVFMAAGVSVKVSAQEGAGKKTGFYAALDGGARGYLSQAEVTVSPTLASSALAADYDAGYIFGGGVGYDTGQGLRFELAGSYSKNKGDLAGFREVLDRDGRLASTLNFGADFDVSTLNILTKGFFDLHLKSFANFVPYAGIQLGYGRSKADVSGLPNVSDNHFVYGGITGFRYLLNENFSAGLESGSLIYYDKDDPAVSYNFKARVYYSF